VAHPQNRAASEYQPSRIKKNRLDQEKKDSKLMNDPFAEDLAANHHDQPSAATRLFAKFRESINSTSNPNASEDVGTPTQQRSDFPAVAGHHVHHSQGTRGAAHPRTVSEDIDDHMDGSVHQGSDVCPSCGYIRMSSVYCPVSQLHHGTDLPAETPRRKKPSLFSRIRDSMSGLTPLGGAEDGDPNADPTTHADAGDVGVNGAGTVVAPASPSQGITSLFSKTREEKQIADLIHLEEKARKQIVEVVKLSVHEIDRQLTAIHKDVRDVLRAHERTRNAIAFEFKTEFDKFYAERKRELEDIKKDFIIESKLLLKKEKERKKHACGDTATETEVQPCEQESDVAAPVVESPDEDAADRGEPRP
jgi:hypothetical protein